MTTPPAPPRPRVRFWEVDALRGVAIIMMVIYHLAWDIEAYGIAAIGLHGPAWQSFQRATASLFLLLVGVSLHLSIERWRATGQPPGVLWGRQLRRAAVVLGGGLLVTAITWLAVPSAPVLFGILHLIGVSIVLATPFHRLGGWNAPLGLAVILAAQPLRGLTVPFPWLLWLGLVPTGFASVDYFPLLPWFGVVLLGLAAGPWLYPNLRRRLPLPDRSGALPIRLLGWMGRRSLIIYLLHQPALVLLLVVTGLLPPGRLGF
jgi:uncharacterized membrane protein